MVVTDQQPGSPVVRALTLAAVVMVALIAAVVSYSHMAQLAARAGEAWRSCLIPLSIDGLVVAASMVLITRRRNNLPGSGLAWGALGAGVAASLAANIADAQPTVTAHLIGGWPAVAFAVAFELLLQQRRAEDHRPPPEPAPVSDAAVIPLPGSHRPLPAAPDVAAMPVDSAPHALPVSTPVVPAVATTTPLVTASPATPAVEPPSRVSHDASSSTRGDDLVERVRQLVADSEAAGHKVGRRAVAKRFDVSEHRARGLLDLVAASGSAVLNGAGGSRRVGADQEDQ